MEDGMAAQRKVYYLQIEDAGTEERIQEARRQLYSLGKIMQFGKGTARDAAAGWVVLYTTAGSIEDLRKRLALIRMNERVLWISPAPSMAAAAAMARQLPLCS